MNNFSVLINKHLPKINLFRFLRFVICLGSIIEGKVLHEYFYVIYPSNLTKSPERRKGLDGHVSDLISYYARSRTICILLQWSYVIWLSCNYGTYEPVTIQEPFR